MLHDHPCLGPSAIRTQFGAIFVSLELSRSSWVLTALSPGNGERMSQYSLRAGDIGGLLARFADLKGKAEQRTGTDYPIIAIHEAGLDGFWVHRVLQKEGIESHVVDAAIRNCAPRWCNWPGSGCATSRNRRWPAGFVRAASAAARAHRRAGAQTAGRLMEVRQAWRRD
jgi:GNAT superfamily N-acetyltransferase